MCFSSPPAPLSPQLAQSVTHCYSGTLVKSWSGGTVTAWNIGNTYNYAEAQAKCQSVSSGGQLCSLQQYCPGLPSNHTPLYSPSSADTWSPIQTVAVSYDRFVHTWQPTPILPILQFLYFPSPFFAPHPASLCTFGTLCPLAPHPGSRFKEIYLTF